MVNPLSSLDRECIDPFTHIFLSLDVIETSPLSEEVRDCVNIIRRNAERLEQLIKEWHHQHNSR